MFASLEETELLFFSPAVNALPRHVRIDYPPVRFLKQVGVSLWLHFNARRIIEEYRLDRLNIHAGPGGVLCMRGLGVPVIVTCHHTYLQQISHIRSQFWKRLFLPFERRTYRRAVRIVAVSEATRDALVGRYGVDQAKVTVIHNAVDTGRFRPLATPKEPCTLLYLGRLDRRKGIEFLLRSMPGVVDRLPDARLLVGGTGSLLPRMKTLVRDLGLKRHVTFLGFVPEEELNGLYNRVQCVVVPSVFEGFGITVIEALAAGTRVVGTDVDGIREILADGASGRLVPYGDRQALADAIVAELRSPCQAAPLGQDYLLSQFARRYQAVLQAPDSGV